MRELVETLPGMPELVAALDGLPPAYLVGGAVRDLLRDAPGDVLDIDVAVEGDAPAAARVAAQRLGGEAIDWERFGTAELRAPGLPFSVNLATTRCESYASPGALPDVSPAPLVDDLGRRDFSINAMAVGLSGPEAGALHDPYGGREDLGNGLVRVLHERSFLDDPTRLLRAVRYSARLGGRLEERTEELARAAIAAGAVGTVSGKRVRDELIDLLRERNAPAAVAQMRALGLDAALHPGLRADPDRAASALLACAETGADPALATLAALIAGSPGGAEVSLLAWLDDLALTRDERERVARAAVAGPRLARSLAGDVAASGIHALLHGEPVEALAVALAFGAPGDPVLHYVRDLSGARLEVTGDDLVAAGVPESPALGRALAGTLRAKLDGEVSGRDDELALALQLAREAGE